MKLIYWIRRRIRSLGRSLFKGEVPEWLSDLYSVLGHVNFINLIPTLYAILAAPEHFFRRVDLLVGKRKSGVKRSVYKSPIKLITTVATLGWTTKWLGAYVPVGRQKEVLAAILISLPVLIPSFSLILLPVGRVALFFATHGIQPCSSSDGFLDGLRSEPFFGVTRAFDTSVYR
jgi:hypothetical protein